MLSDGATKALPLNLHPACGPYQDSMGWELGRGCSLDLKRPCVCPRWACMPVIARQPSGPPGSL